MQRNLKTLLALVTTVMLGATLHGTQQTLSIDTGAQADSRVVLVAS